MRKSLRLFFLLLFCLMVNTVTAQVISLKGTVTSAEDNSPLPGVTVQIKGQTKGTITDFNGNYSLQVDADASLVFSYVGYEAMTVPIQGQLVKRFALVNSRQISVADLEKGTYIINITSGSKNINQKLIVY